MPPAKRKASNALESTRGRPSTLPGPRASAQPATVAPAETRNPIPEPAYPADDQDWEDGYGDAILHFEEGKDHIYCYLGDTGNFERLGTTALITDRSDIKVETVVRELARMYNLIIPDESRKFTYVMTMNGCEDVDRPNLTLVDVMEIYEPQTCWDEVRKDWEVGVRFHVRRWVPKYTDAS